jgi:hypothetical protein
MTFTRFLDRLALQARGLFGVIFLGMLSTGWAAEQTPPASHVVVYDASGSMYRTDTGEYRYRLAQAAVRHLTEALRQLRMTTPTGMVIFGRKYSQKLKRCDDIEIAVPIAPISGTDTLDRIAAEGMRSLPNGQTPLLWSMLEAARQMPAGGGLITVITDLDEETCGGDPCRIGEELGKIGKPMGSVVRVGFIVATGLQQGRNTVAVERFSKCVNGRLLIVGSIAEAHAAADRIAADLAAQLPPPAEPSSPRVAQANIAQAQVDIVARFGVPVDLPEWTFSEAHAYITYQTTGLAKVLLQGNQATLDAPARIHTFNLLRETANGSVDNLGSAKAVDVRAGVPNHVEITVDPARIVLHAVAGAPNQSLDSVRFDWTLEGYGRQVSSPETGPRASFSVPPGQYAASVAVSGGTLADQTPQKTMIEVKAGQTEERSYPIKLQSQGELALHAKLQEPTNFRQTENVPPAFVLTDAQGLSKPIGQGWDLPGKKLDPGSYVVTARLGNYTRTVKDVVILADRLTSIQVAFVPARVVVRAHRSDGSAVTEPNITWKISRDGTSATEPAAGAVLDILVPAGTYRVDAYSRTEGDGSDRVSVEDGQIAERTITLRRAGGPSLVATAGPVPSVELTLVPPPGGGSDSWGTIAGKTTGANPAEHRIVIYAGTDYWYVQPLANNTFTKLKEDGSFKTEIHLGCKYAALLVDGSFVPQPKQPGLPGIGRGVLATTQCYNADGEHPDCPDSYRCRK